MPELLTKHPDIVLQILKTQGAQCGPGTKAKILTRCPAEKFCTLQGGELCIYGPGEMSLMTQLSCGEVCAAPRKSSVADGPVPGIAVTALVAAALALMLLAARSRRRAKT